ncbi:DUF5082 domain-containing protein [Amphibacillus sp. MSJ-3]|uniref:DUF5082 family protein n=1 Tax=Amphibacillus sp. MSJ-3 TaxID=2841505 RepID=UPI001C0EE0F3|nr:DUF5082 family protein [Amphibacillus sp. MSJ-3]MBU5594934.1 DUF5082 domain-containing protein [Amphibacillus sp. MSJ-3]
MNFWSTISGYQSEINNRVAEIDRKIERLEQAKRKIEQEQKVVLEEIEQLKKPDIDQNWTGKFANDYENKRDDVYLGMRSLAYDSYDLYQSTIELKINSFNLQRSGLVGLRSLVSETNQLLNFGEEVYDEVSNKINYIRRELFG